jgi:hypothetical protein
MARTELNRRAGDAAAQDLAGNNWSQSSLLNLGAQVTLPFHPRANLFPLIAGAEFDELIEDIHLGRFVDGRLAEIFLLNHKSGSQADANARDSAVVCSLALQHGVPVETIRRALLGDSREVASIGAALGAAP